MVPILPPLARSIEATKTGDLSFIIGERGRAMVKEAFGIWFRRACDEAGCPGQRTGFARLAQHGRLERRDGRSATRFVRMARRSDAEPVYKIGRHDQACDGGGVEARKERNPKIYSLTRSKGEGLIAKTIIVSRT